MTNYKLTLCYDGSRYKGWQKQGNTENTIQGKTEALLSKLLGQEIEINGCGRTDAGVHAREQVCSFRANTELSDDALLAEIRRYLPEDIGATSLEKAEPRFHARLSCKEKTYLYRLWVSPASFVFDRKFVTKWEEPLNLEAMKQAAALLCGEHDFTAFTSNKHMKKSAVRSLREIRFEQTENELRLYFTGDGFLYNMVRILVGTLLEVGSGKRSPVSIPSLLEGKDREQVGFTAPPQGLILYSIKY